VRTRIDRLRDRAISRSSQNLEPHLPFLITVWTWNRGVWLCYFRALKLGNAAQVAPIDKLSVVLVAIFGVAFLGERLSAVNWLGVLLVASGAILVAVR
jgi:bacterial/archaeal transporter family protein